VNKVEAIKAERDGLEVGADIERYATDGWESIPDDDLNTRLKWWGVFYRKQTPGHFMMRIRIPNGIATAAQLRTIGEIAEERGRGTLDLTTRQQVQLRWIRIESIPGIIERLAAVDLVTLQTGMDNIRNVVGCAVAGLTPNELLDASGVAREFTEMFVGNREFTNLPRKINVTITGCLDNCVHAETQDIALVPARLADGTPGFNLLVGGKMGSGGYRVATPLDVFLLPAEAARVAAEIVLLFRDHGSRSARNHARLAFLVDEWGAERVRAELEARIGRALLRAGSDARHDTSTDHIGVWRQAAGGLNYVGLLVPVGRMSAKHLLELARLSEVYGTGEVRLTIGQNAIVPNIPDAKLPALQGEALLQQLRYDPSPVARGTVSCTGKDFCALALIESKGYALELVDALEKSGVTTSKPISMHWSGCISGCGNHQAADIGFVGRQTRVDGKVIDAVDVFVGGASGPGAIPGVKVLENVPCADLPRLVPFLVRHGDFKHMREQMHALEGGVAPAAGD
jgi:ferredoxin-nitrite reductase